MSTTDLSPARDAFIVAACAPRTGSHASGTLDDANALLEAHPGLATLDIFTASILGEADAVRAALAVDPSLANATSAVFGWDALTHLCFSRYLRLDPSRSDALVATARVLLEGGARATTGFHEDEHLPSPTFESVLYGAAGIAHHAAMTQLLIDHGADPNDDEVPYHAPEGYDLAALRVLLDSGRVSANSLTTMLLRKSDWHDYDGMQLLLERGADPNGMGTWGKTPLAHAIRSDNRVSLVTLLLDSGADPTRIESGMTPIAMAAWAGRADLLALFAARGFALDRLSGFDALAAACALCDADRAHGLLRDDPSLQSDLDIHGALLMVRFAGVGNVDGLRQLLALGVPVDATEQKGEGYFNRAPQSTALHTAAWRARHDVVELLLSHGASPRLTDGRGRTPLMLAVLACVESYWTEERSTRSIAALLAAGAAVTGVRYPSGYNDADALLAAHGAQAGG